MISYFFGSKYAKIVILKSFCITTQGSYNTGLGISSESDTLIMFYWQIFYFITFWHEK